MDFVTLAIVLGAFAVFGLSASSALRMLRGGKELDVSLADDEELRELGELTERKHVIMEMIRSADLDLDMKKIAEEDHKRTVRQLEREAVAVMKRIDEIRGSDSDRAKADAAMKQATALIGVEDDAGNVEVWSAAARARHGGRRPTPEGT